MRLLAVVDLWTMAVRYKVILWHRCTDVAHSPQTDLAPHRDIDILRADLDGVMRAGETA